MNEKGCHTAVNVSDKVTLEKSVRSDSSGKKQKKKKHDRLDDQKKMIWSP